MRACKCPACGAELNIDDNNRDFAFCQYCGAKIMLDDYRSTQRIVDEARIKEDETKRMVRMRELDMEEQKIKMIDEDKKSQTLTSVIVYTIASILIIIGFISIMNDDDAGILWTFIGVIIARIHYVKERKNNDKLKELEMIQSGMIKFNCNNKKFEGNNYGDVQTEMKKMGFKNIVVINMNDLTLGLLSKPGAVDSIMIDGKYPQKGVWYSPKSHVEIFYHGFPNDR